MYCWLQSATNLASSGAHKNSILIEMTAVIQMTKIRNKSPPEYEMR